MGAGATDARRKCSTTKSNVIVLIMVGIVTQGMGGRVKNKKGKTHEQDARIYQVKIALVCGHLSQNGYGCKWMNVQACNKQVANKTLHHLAKTSLLFRLLSFGSMFVNRHGTGVVSF